MTTITIINKKIIITMKTTSFGDFKRGNKKCISLKEIPDKSMRLKYMPKIINTRSLQIRIIWNTLTMQVIWQELELMYGLLKRLVIETSPFQGMTTTVQFNKKSG